MRSNPVLGVHRITTYARFSILKKPDFNLVPDFLDPTSGSSPGLKIVRGIAVEESQTNLDMIFGVKTEENSVHNTTVLLCNTL